MCICFIYLNNNIDDGSSSSPSSSTADYQLVVINNRDEYYERPTKPASLWNGSCISGLDQQANRENGTWLGVNTIDGKVGILLNILQPNCDSTKKGRGFLVTDFISGNEDVIDYADRIAKEKHEYNKFNLVLLQKKNNKWHVLMVSTESNELKGETLDQNILAFGNSAYERPWLKVKESKVKFEEIIKSHRKNNDISDEGDNKLKDEMLKLLTDKTKHWPDCQILSQLNLTGKSHQQQKQQQHHCQQKQEHDAKMYAFGKKLSSNFVEVAETKYGTRTHSLILIDKVGKGEYIEVDMRATSTTTAAAVATTTAAAATTAEATEAAVSPSWVQNVIKFQFPSLSSQ
ncbi:hypothetical protein HELRODRAFT_171971 [Helobdella robusta]|uniref:Transport and Golgi organization protein 2 homolog n=1 Tax=Helobdella robusta TaxID=6412 RepID=T1F4W7_HELRO|nr:hypothetical protein HELRODRAFT_171971 [Helobdella robusta]ESO04963.1 hypothetical protein HELRODRAFT_171971 [Helobdella robusta]